ncbi:sarcosine oxidase subunit gamma family protein [Shinella sp. S4-D37]|uniref:sarcosine oxidase subunit gamma family protein n=1 Tax=Shinella sp. S4-D37 TaxID=3161999 RepID=UPI0034670BC7
MLDLSRTWRPEPDWAEACLAGPGITILAITSLTQRLVSGDLGRFLAQYDLGGDVGGLKVASGERYAVRLARDRMLVVGLATDECADGWHAAGYAVTSIGSGQRVLEMRGEGVRDLLARAVTVDPDHAGPSAAMPFGGVTCAVYCHEGPQALRVHVERGLAASLWEWLECQLLLSREASVQATK